jgi:hypothetical protein
MKVLLSLSLLFAGIPLHATTLFSDNFESYTAGANLAGQGGWTGCGSIPIGTSSALPTQVARADLGSAGCSGNLTGFAVIDHSFSGSIADNVTTILSFNAYAPSGAHDSGVWLTDLGGNNLNGVLLSPDMTVPGWTLLLYKNGGANDRVNIPGGTGAPVFMEIVIDVPDQTVYAKYDFGSGLQTTSTLSLAGDNTLSQWNTLSVVGDYRFGLPQDQIDNINLTQSPEPSTLLSTTLSALGLLALKIRARRKSTS